LRFMVRLLHGLSDDVAGFPERRPNPRRGNLAIP
jgi:hypothetical protein